MEQYRIYTDGSCNNLDSKPRIGGWAFVVVCGDRIDGKHSGVEYSSNSQRCELLAFIQALGYFIDFFPIEKNELEIFTDSMYIVETLQEKRWVRWEECKWFGVKNKELWKNLIKLYKILKNVKVTHVKGHSGNKYNEMVDKMAKQAREDERKRSRSDDRLFGKI